MERPFIKYKHIINEFKGYKTVVDYEEYFNNLSRDVKKDLEFLSEYHYNDYKKNDINNLLTITSKIPSVKKIDDMPIEINLYLIKDCKKNIFSDDITNKIGINVCLSAKEYISEDVSDLLQNIYLLDCNIDDKEIFKNYIYNILFYAYMITQYFEYHPLLKYLYHKDDISYLVNIRQTYIRLFGEEDLSCSVCLEKTITKTNCNHYICQKCFCLLEKKKCPLCRKELINNNYRFILNF